MAVLGKAFRIALFRDNISALLSNPHNDICFYSYVSRAAATASSRK